VSFDRAAAVYDRTRMTDPAHLAVAASALNDALPDGTALEIGVGTGVLAVPLAAHGRTVAGVDLAPAMLERLLERDPDRSVLVTVADATRLPFREDVFVGAYCRWVLHLVADWEAAVRELCRVAWRRVIVEPGGYVGEWRELYLRFIAELGEAAAPVGLDFRNGLVDLDAAFESEGATLADVFETPGILDTTLERFLAEAEAKSYSWTWRVPQEDLDRAVEAVRAWATVRYGPDLDRSVEPDGRHHWRVYDLA
jgi:SAM-dependent methyltransferase